MTRTYLIPSETHRHLQKVCLGVKHITARQKQRNCGKFWFHKLGLKELDNKTKVA